MKNIIDCIHESNLFEDSWFWKDVDKRLLMHTLVFDRLEKEILDNGYEFVREKENRFWNYRFYSNDEKKKNLRIYYDNSNKHVREISWSTYDDPEEWHEIKPDCRKPNWRKLFTKYDK